MTYQNKFDRRSLKFTVVAINDGVARARQGDMKMDTGFITSQTENLLRQRSSAVDFDSAENSVSSACHRRSNLRQEVWHWTALFGKAIFLPPHSGPPLAAFVDWIWYYDGLYPDHSKEHVCQTERSGSDQPP
jgi:hypothetical protein